MKDDSSGLPFYVECNGSGNWYTQEQLVLATTITNTAETAIKIGSHVSVRPGVTPKHNWGSVKPNSVGVVKSLNSDGVGCTVDFPEQSGWNGVLSEMMLASTSKKNEEVSALSPIS